MKKRVVSILCLACLFAALFSAGVSADSSGSCGDRLTWTLDSGGVLVISGSGAMYDFADARDEPWISFRETINCVVIGSGVTGIGERAFHSCQKIVSVTVPSSVTSIGFNAFKFCDALRTVVYQGSAEAWKAINIAGGNEALTSGAVTYKYGHMVQLTHQKLAVNGAEKTTEIYNIDGSNYFKLRDLAMLLQGTGSRFSVGYDDASKTVTVVTGADYAAVGGELETHGDRSYTYAQSGQSLRVNGEAVSLSAYNIGGNNFFKLRDLGQALYFTVDYDAATQTMLVYANDNAKDIYNAGVSAYNSGDYAKALEMFAAAAEQGNAKAMNNLGVYYDNGRGVAQDYAKAVEWYTKAAELGEAQAMSNLGVCYEHGNGVPQDYAKAVEWYTKAAELGNTYAMNNLANCYENGLGVPKDVAKAAEWRAKAEAAG